MKSGLLYPRSKAHPGMMADFMDGIKTALQDQQLTGEIGLVSESIGYGGHDKEVFEKTEKLMTLENVDVLIAFIDLRMLEIIKPLVSSSGKLLIAVHPGANYPQNWKPEPNILNLTLQHSLLCRMCGREATLMKKKAAAMFTTFYDSGYLHTAAMVRGFVKEGGEITFNQVYNGPYDDSFSIQPLTDHLSSTNETDSLLCVLDSLPASLFYTSLHQYKGAHIPALYVSPMMLEEEALENLPEGFRFDITGYLPWHISANGSANRYFTDTYKKQTQKEATIFSLLGWEAALVLQQVYAWHTHDRGDGAIYAEALKKISFDSPRGTMKLDPVSQFFLTPAVKCTIPGNSGKAIFEWNTDTEEEWKSFTEEKLTGVASGWTNTYLCY